MIDLRDLFAIVRMAARSVGTLGALHANPDHVAKDAYATADEMMKARQQPAGPQQ